MVRLHSRGGTIIVDAKFVRALQLDDDELALIFAHEAAHVPPVGADRGQLGAGTILLSLEDGVKI